MKPWLASLVAALALSACSEPGRPWGWLTVSLDQAFQPGADRLDDAGRLVTSQNYAVRIDELSARFETVSVVLGAGGAAAFDPANPPAGYSLCHNGHCHHDSGELVDYATIAMELAGGASGSRVTLATDESEQVLDTETTEIVVETCDPSPCELPMGELVGVELNMASLHLVAMAYDRLEGDRARLPEEGVELALDLPLELDLGGALSGTIGLGEPIGLDLKVGFRLPPQLFDGLDFGAADPSEYGAAIRSAIAEKTELIIESQRFTEEPS